MTLRDEIAREIADGIWRENLSPSEIADRILALPAIAEALEAVAREESHSNIYDEPED